MTNTPLPLLQFDEGYFERIWGGQKLREQFTKPIPADRPIGEAWLISDHGVHESVVAHGSLKGVSLRQLLRDDPVRVLGTRAALTVHGRFPLLLKILDAADYLSVQVHPDDVCAAALGEGDVGKTEMWHVLQADPGSELICGLAKTADPEQFRDAAADGSIEAYLRRFAVAAGASVYVPAGTVHAIGKGIVLAEIQQNSDLTYRLYDWGRLQSDGRPRELHLDKSVAATHFQSRHGGIAPVLSYQTGNTMRTVLAACQYFAAERVDVDETCELTTNNTSFHIVLAADADLEVACGADRVVLEKGRAVLVPGSQLGYRVCGSGRFLLYYVPDIPSDIVTPLRAAGHGEDAIAQLLGI